MKKNNLKANIIFAIAALIWGLAFVAQDKVSSLVEPFTVNAVRSYIGAAVLVPVSAVLSPKEKDKSIKKKKRKDLLIAGLLCGSFLCVAINFQQFGIGLYPDEAAASGRTGFLTALYVVLFPVFGLFSGKKPAVSVWLAVFAATVGMYLLCLGGGVGGLYVGDVFVLACAVAFTLQMMCVDKYISKVDGIKLSSMQFFVCALISTVFVLIFEKPSIQSLLSAAPGILFLGVMSSGTAYTLQIIGQKYSDNTAVGAVIMSLESVFAALGGAVISGERMSLREICGCFVMFTAVILSQLPNKINLNKSDAT